MSKTLKKVVSIVFSLFVAFVLLLPSLFTNAGAKAIKAGATSVDYSDVERLDNYFEWTNGASINKETDDSFLRSMRFRLNILDTDFAKLKHKNDQITMTFDIVRVAGTNGEKQEAVYSLKLVWSDQLFYMKHKKYGIDDKTISDVSVRQNAVRVSPLQTPDEQYLFDNADYADALAQIEAGGALTKWQEGAVLVYGLLGSGQDSAGYNDLDYVSMSPEIQQLTTKTSEEGLPCLDVVIDVNSQNSEYFVVANYNVRHYKGTAKRWNWKKFRYETYNVYHEGEAGQSGKIKSPTRSVYGVLENIEAAGALETEFSGDQLTAVNDILGNTVTKAVDVTYLEQIGSTPFAQKVKKRVTVPILNDVINHDDVCAALNVASLDALGSSIKHFKLDTYGNYAAEYLSSVRVEAKTTDGNKEDYFLECNKTFNEFYGGFKTDGVFGEGFSENMLNWIKQKYPTTKNYTGDELYGLWGFVTVPKTTTVSSIMTDIFDVPTNFSGSIHSYYASGTLSLTAYNKLLQNYGYNFLERVWLGAVKVLTNVGKADCTHYAFIAAPEVEAVNIGENGGGLGNEDSYVSNEVKETVSDIVKGVESVTKTTEAATADLWRGFRVILAVGGVAALGLAVAYGVIILKRANAKK